VIVWLDEQLSPDLARWLVQEFEVMAQPVRDLGLKSATDPEIYFAAHEAGAVVIIKDQDFVRLLERHGPPPQVIWVTCGNTSNAKMRAVFSASFRSALELLRKGESLVEISDAR
jgi:predicted nuclease of predicted toxin-antitoxin system